MQEPGPCSRGRASAHSQALLEGICMGFGWGVMERIQVFPNVSLQPPRAKLWLCSCAAGRAETSFSFAGAGGEGLRLHRAWAQAWAQCHTQVQLEPRAVCWAGWSPFPRGSSVTASVPFWPRLRALQRWLIPSWGGRGDWCLRATCSLHAACQAPVSHSPTSLLLAGQIKSRFNGYL